MTDSKSNRKPGESADPAAQARFEALAEKAEAQMEASQKARREAETKARLEAAKGKAANVQSALAEEEAALRQRGPALNKDLPPAEEQEAGGFFQRLRQGIAKTRDGLTGGLARLVLGRKEVAPDLLRDLEDLLLTADVGTETTQRLIKAIQERLRRSELEDAGALQGALREEILRVMQRPVPPVNLGAKPAVILFVGVNGTGKTTSVGKLGAMFQAQGKRVLLAAGDTFRAAAAEQLEGWAKRSNLDLFSKPAGSDPAAVVFQAVQKGQQEGYDLVLCDTAGRLHTKVHLMEELKKVKRVLAKAAPGAPHETWLVLDANTGQNAIRQARDFHQAVGVTGLVLTKLDGTARGGVVIGIVNEFDFPIRYIGVGESVEDLRPFDAQQYVASLFD
ncbi:MAG TPA: signal recognition particle-docking protein FtsY [bacterium]